MPGSCSERLGSVPSSDATGCGAEGALLTSHLLYAGCSASEKTKPCQDLHRAAFISNRKSSVHAAWWTGGSLCCTELPAFRAEAVVPDCCSLRMS